MLLATSWCTLQDPLGMAVEFFFKIEMEEPLVSTLGNISKIKIESHFFDQGFRSDGSKTFIRTFNFEFRSRPIPTHSWV